MSGRGAFWCAEAGVVGVAIQHQPRLDPPACANELQLLVQLTAKTCPGVPGVLGTMMSMVMISAPDEVPERHLFVLPGVPRELHTIFDEEIAPRYLGDGRPHVVEEVHFEMAVEAEFWRVLRKVEQEFSDVSVGSYPQPDRGHLVIRVAGADAARVHAAAATVRAEGPGRLR